MTARTYKSPKGIAIALTVSFILMIGVMYLRFCADGAGMDFVNKIEQHQRVTAEEEQSIDAVQDFVSKLSLGATLLIAALFITWMVRLRDNVEALGATELKNNRYVPIWSWMVPIINLFKPVLAMQELWKASDPEQLDPVNWKSSRASWLIWAWWLFWFLYCFLSKLADFFATQAIKNNQLQMTMISGYYSTSLLAQVGGALAAILALCVIWKLTLRQSAKHALVCSGGLSSSLVDPVDLVDASEKNRAEDVEK